MRSIVAGLSVIGLAGCATVSMVPGEATVETGLSVQQSALRTSSDAFCDGAREAGWVETTGGVAGLAKILMHGQNEETTEASSDYAQSINAETEAPAAVFSRVAADADEARRELAAVTVQADAVLYGDIDARRGDLMSFERSLVTAQKAHRNFARAADVAAARTGVAPDSVDAALAGFAGEIDRARKVADQLADRYAAINRTIS